MQGNRYAVNYDISNAPTDDSTHSYQCDLDTTTGTWQFSYDGTAWQSYQDDYWKTAVGATVSGQEKSITRRMTCPEPLRTNATSPVASTVWTVFTKMLDWSLETYPVMILMNGEHNG
jgi:hypothetical protein